MIEVIEIPLGATAIRAFADSKMVLYCTSSYSDDKLRLGAEAWKHINNYVRNYRKPAL